MNKLKTSNSFNLPNYSSLIPQQDNETNSDQEGYNSSLDDHVPHFGGTAEEPDQSSEEPEELEDQNSSNEEDEADLLSELRQLTRNITNGIPSKGKKQGTGKVDSIFDELAPTKKSVKDFDDYYQKSFKKFLKKKEDDIDKLRKIKQENEATELKNKPELVAKQHKKKHIPIANRVEIIQAKKERELMKLKKQQEEKMEKELSELTFTPKINHVAPSHLLVQKRELSPSNKRPQTAESGEVGKGASRVKVNKNGGRDNNQRETVNKPSNNAQAQTKQTRKINKQDPQSQKVSASVSRDKTPTRVAKGPIEIPTQTRITEKKAVIESARTANMNVEKPKTPLKSHREVSPVPAKETEIKSYRSQEKQARSETDDFLNEQEALVQKFYDMVNGSPQKQASMNKLENLMNYYSEQRTTNGSQSERQNRIIRQQVARQGTPVSAERVSVSERSSMVERSSVAERSSVKSSKRETVEKDMNSMDSLSPERKQSLGKVFLTPSSQRMEVLKEEAEEQEENEIDNIKQNLMSIQDNIQTLKQSFKNFQDAQASSKTEIPSVVETPRKSQQIVLTGNLNQQVNQQETEKKMASPPVSNPVVKEIRASNIKKETQTIPQTANNPVVVVKEVQASSVRKEVQGGDVRSKTPPPTVVAVKKSSPPGDNKAKQPSPTPAQKKGSQVIKVSSETSGYAKKRPVQEVQSVQQVKVEEKKMEEKKEEVVKVVERNVNEIEHLSLGNVSFSGNKSGMKIESKVVESVNVKEEVEERREQMRRSDVWQRKNSGEGGDNYRGALEPTSLLSRPKTNDNTQSLKDIAQMTLLKFKGLAPKTNGVVEGYVSAYSSMKRGTMNK